MKKLFKVAIVAVCLLSAGNFAKAQTKIGYIDYQAVLNAMPETKTIETTLAAYSKGFQDELNVMQTELQTKDKELQAQSTTMTDAVKRAKIDELNDIQKRIQAYNTDAQQKVQAKVNELRKPVDDRLMAAISAVAKDKGYAYVFDTSQQMAAEPLMLIKPQADDMTDAVKAELKIK